MKCNAKEYLKLQKKVTLKEAKRQFAASRRQLGLEPIEKDLWKCGREDYCISLLKKSGLKTTAGSNPAASANLEKG